MASGLKAIEVLVTENMLDIDTLFALMTNQARAEQQDLPDTGLSGELELLLSSIFIVSPDYGTRSSAIILQSTTGEVSVYEHNYNNQGEVSSDQCFSFNLVK